MSKTYGKGDKPRNCFSKQFKNNYDSINWSDEYIDCSECGQPYKKKDVDKYMIQDEDKTYRCIKCNFN